MDPQESEISLTKLIVQVEILKEALGKALSGPCSIDEVAQHLQEQGNFTLAEIARALDVNRNLFYRKKKSITKNGERFYSRKDEQEVLPMILAVKRDNPGWGYRKVTEEINAQRALTGLPLFNKKRILRLLKKYQDVITA